MLVSIKRQLNYLPAFRVAKTPCQIHIPKLATKIGQKVVDCFLPQKNLQLENLKPLLQTYFARNG